MTSGSYVSVDDYFGQSVQQSLLDLKEQMMFDFPASFHEFEEYIELLAA